MDEVMTRGRFGGFLHSDGNPSPEWNRREKHAALAQAWLHAPKNQQFFVCRWNHDAGPQLDFTGALLLTPARMAQHLIDHGVDEKIVQAVMPKPAKLSEPTKTLEDTYEQGETIASAPSSPSKVTLADILAEYEDALVKEMAAEDVFLTTVRKSQEKRNAVVALESMLRTPYSMRERACLRAKKRHEKNKESK